MRCYSVNIEIQLDNNMIECKSGGSGSLGHQVLLLSLALHHFLINPAGLISTEMYMEEIRSRNQQDIAHGFTTSNWRRARTQIKVIRGLLFPFWLCALLLSCSPLLTLSNTRHPAAGGFSLKWAEPRPDGFHMCDSLCLENGSAPPLLLALHLLKEGLLPGTGDEF